MARRRRRASDDSRLVGRRKQVAVGFLIAAAHTSAQLVQVAQAEVLGVVHDDRIGIGNVDAVLDDGRGDQHIEFPIDEVHDQPLQASRQASCRAPRPRGPWGRCG